MQVRIVEKIVPPSYQKSLMTYDPIALLVLHFLQKMDFLLAVLFSTNSLFKLETWHNEVDKSSLLNTHVIQAICLITLFPPPPPFLLSTYGTNGKYTAKDVLSRWITIFDLCMGQNIRILGFMSDCDSKNLKAMCDSMVFLFQRKNWP